MNASQLDSRAETTDGSAERAARIETVYRQLPVTIGAAMANAILTGAVLAPVAPLGKLLLWIGSVALLSMMRLAAWYRFTRHGAERTIQSWETISVGGAALSGALWGLLSAALMPSEQPYPVFVAFIVGGMCAGSATFNAPHLPTVMAFVLPSVLPLAKWFAFQGTRFDAAMAAMSTIFAVSLLITATRFGRFFDDSVRTRIDLAKRTEALAAANERLRAEMDERQATEAALRHAQKMEAVGNLTAGVAHDINNVLMAISGSAELLKEQTPARPQDEPLLEAIFLATERGARLTRHLLAFARKEVLDPAIVDLNGVLRNISNLLEATLGRSIRVELRLRDGLAPVFVDRNEIERAIINLAINAHDAMPHGGTLTLATDNVPEPPPLDDGPLDFPCVVVVVRDTGVGMAPEVAERAFDPFFTTKPSGRGSGLGLSQVYGLVKQSGGATKIDSVEGVGTVIRLYLPQASQKAVEAARRARGTGTQRQAGTAAGQPAQGHIVVVDDGPMVVTVVSSMLRNAGYRITSFGIGTDAVACVTADPSVIAMVSDFGLPDCRGNEVTRRARLVRPGMPVVVITGYNDSTLLAGEPYQLRKPFAEAELLAIVRRAVLAAAPPPG